MKPVQVLFDEALLSELDDDERVRRKGRSSVLRELAAAYLKERRLRLLEAQYRTGYGAGVCEDLAGWGEEGEWPDE